MRVCLPFIHPSGTLRASCISPLLLVRFSFAERISAVSLASPKNAPYPPMITTRSVTWVAGRLLPAEKGAYWHCTCFLFDYPIDKDSHSANNLVLCFANCVYCV